MPGPSHATAVDSPPPPSLELYDPVLYETAPPNDALRWIRNHDPVYWQEEPDGPGYWAITKYDDIAWMSKNPGTFSSHRGGTNIEDYEPKDLMLIRLMMLNMDPPQHVKFRRLVRRGFTPRQVQKLVPKVRATAKRLVDAVAKQGECEFVSTIAAELPLLAIADLLGLPEEDRHQIFDWTNTLIGFSDPEFNTSMQDSRMAAAQMWGYANNLAKDRTNSDADDLVSVLMRGEVDGHSLSIPEFDGFFLLLAVAGNETTRNAISGGLRVLLDNPDQLQRLVADPSLIPSAVEEMLRWVTPVMYFRRTLTKDVELRGKTLKDGDKVAMYYLSANRDEEHFEDPYRFDVGRTPNHHLAFGVGEHFCLGASLARLEMQAIFSELVSRMPDMKIAGDVRRLRSNFINGIKEMHLTFTPEP